MSIFRAVQYCDSLERSSRPVERLVLRRVRCPPFGNNYNFESISIVRFLRVGTKANSRSWDCLHRRRQCEIAMMSSRRNLVFKDGIDVYVLELLVAITADRLPQYRKLVFADSQPPTIPREVSHHSPSCTVLTTTHD
jgi:hypothetical protein